MNALRTALVAALLAVGLMVPSLAVAQGTMTFGEEEAKEVQEGEGGKKKKKKKQKSQKPLVGIVAVPTKAINSSQRERLQEELVSIMKKVPDVELDTSTAVLDALKKRTVATCVTEPLCLGTVGEEAGVDWIMMARVRKKGGNLALDLDYFDVSDRLFTKYRGDEDLGGFGQVMNRVTPLVKEMFELDKRETTETVSQNTGVANTVVAISSAVLSAGGIAGGIVFGLQAQDIQKQLDDKETNQNGVYKDPDFTQQKADRMLGRAKSKALTANIFYGLAGVFGATSAIMFIIQPGSDVAEDQQARNRRLELDVVPVFGPEGAGLNARLKF